MLATLCQYVGRRPSDFLLVLLCPGRVSDEDDLENESDSRPTDAGMGETQGRSAVGSGSSLPSSPSAAGWNPPVRSERATAAAETSLRPTCNSPAVTVPVEDLPLCSRFSSSSTSSSPRPWMNCMT